MFLAQPLRLGMGTCPSLAPCSYFGVVALGQFPNCTAKLFLLATFSVRKLSTWILLLPSVSVSLLPNSSGTRFFLSLTSDTSCFVSSVRLCFLLRPTGFGQHPLILRALTFFHRLYPDDQTTSLSFLPILLTIFVCFFWPSLSSQQCDILLATVPQDRPRG